mgnify:CR=1 FL=1
MAYSARLRKAVGAVRATLSAVELCDVQAPNSRSMGTMPLPPMRRSCSWPVQAGAIRWHWLR